MDKTITLRELIDDVERVSGEEDCLTCRRFYYILLQLKAVLIKEQEYGDRARRFLTIIEKAAVTHGPGDCNPCRSLPISDAISAITSEFPIDTVRRRGRL